MQQSEIEVCILFKPPLIPLHCIKATVNTGSLVVAIVVSMQQSEIEVYILFKPPLIPLHCIKATVKLSPWFNIGVIWLKVARISLRSH